MSIDKIGMYKTDEILEFMTEGEGRGFLGRSMFDTMYFEIERLNNIINELEEYIKPYLYMLNGIQDRDVYEECQLADFTMIMEKLQELKGVDKE